MPIVLRHNEQLELNLAEYHGLVSVAELEAMAVFLGANPAVLKRDSLSLVLHGGDFNSIEFEALDKLATRYKSHFAPIEFQIVRRSAWICRSLAAQAHVDHWIGRPGIREAMSSTLRQFETFAEAGDWLVLSESETVALEAGIGFTEIARFDFGSARAETRAAAARR